VEGPGFGLDHSGRSFEADVMQDNFINTPGFLLDALRKKSFALPSQSYCEYYKTQDSSVRCMVCTAPAAKMGERHLVAAFVSPDHEARAVFLARLQRHVRSVQIQIPAVQIIQCGDAGILLVPWVYRGEFRALVVSVVASYAKPFVVTGPSSLFSSSNPLDFAASGVDMMALRRQLTEFAAAFDSAGRHALRKMLMSKTNQVWRMPLGCTVKESVSHGGVSWKIHFDDLEYLERAHALVDGRLHSGKADLLSLCHHNVHGSNETIMPMVGLMGKSNSRDVRIEMAKLIQSVLVFLDRITFDESLAEAQS